jgi:hypothetical protein
MTRPHLIKKLKATAVDPGERAVDPGKSYIKFLIIFYNSKNHYIWPI